MKKVISIIIFTSLLIWYSFWESNFFNHAEIEWTDILIFDWEVEWNEYKTSLKEEIKYITGNTNKEYPCFPIIGTWYTEKMWEVYFQYNDEGAYYCWDGKYRGKAKLSAWGRIDFEQEWWDSDYFVFSEKQEEPEDPWYYYHTGYAYSDWVGLWNWEYAKTDKQTRQIIYEHIDEDNSYIEFSWQAKANFSQLKDYEIILKDENNNFMNWVYNDKVKILTWENLIAKNWVDKIWFNFEWWGLESSWFTGKIKSIFPWQKQVDFEVSYWDKEINISWQSNFNLPFDADFELVWSVTEPKIWKTYNWRISVTDTNVSNFTWSWDFGYEWNYNYRTTRGANPPLNENFEVQFFPDWDEVDDEVNVFYKISGGYDYEDYEYINFENARTSWQEFKPSTEVDSVSFSKSDNCDSAKWNWQDRCSIQLTAKNNLWYPTPSVDLWDITLEDMNEDKNDHTSFDLDETINNYEEWLFKAGNNYETDSRWQTNIHIYSYKPVKNWEIKIKLQDLNKEIIIEDIFFDKVVDLRFDWTDLWEWVAISENNQVDLVFEKLDSNASDWELNLSWTIHGCDDCEFLSWGSFNYTNFQTQTESIYISGVDMSHITYYDTHYKYQVNWIQWNKTVKLEPNIYINWRWLEIVWQFFWLDLKWLLSRWFNLEQMQDEWLNVSVLWSDIPLSSHIWDIRRDTKNKTRWIESSNSNDDINSIDNKWTKVYDCDWDDIRIDLSWQEVKWQNNLIFWDCEVIIASNIEKENDAHLEIISLQKENNSIDFYSPNWRKLTSNIYITNQVDTIFADIKTDWSIIALSNASWDIDASEIFDDRFGQEELKNQLYINWNIISRNTYLWWINENDKVSLPWWRKIRYDEDNIFGNKEAINVAQTYDINFRRTTFAYMDWSYDTGYLSEEIRNRFNCTWDQDDNEICTKPIIVEDNQN